VIGRGLDALSRMEWKNSAQVLVVASADPNLRRNCEAGRRTRLLFSLFPFPELTRICPSLSGAPSLSGLFRADFKPDLIRLGAEVSEKSAVKLRDF
jgi:hypothetical protein